MIRRNESNVLFSFQTSKVMHYTHSVKFPEYGLGSDFFRLTIVEPRENPPSLT